MGTLHAQLAQDLQKGVIDSDRASALLLCNEELAFMPEDARPIRATRRDLFEELLPVAHLVTADYRAVPALHLGDELARAGEFEAAHLVLEDALERFPEAVRSRPLLLLQMAETERLSGSIAAALARIAQAETAMQRPGAVLDAATERELRTKALELNLNVQLDLGVNLPRYMADYEDLVHLVGTEHPLATLYHARGLLAAGEPLRVIEVASEQIGVFDYSLEDWTKLALMLAEAEVEAAHLEEVSPGRAIAWLEAVIERPGVRAQDRRTAVLRAAQIELHAGNHEAAAAWIKTLEREQLLANQRHRLAVLEARLGLASGIPISELKFRLQLMRAAYDEILGARASAPGRGGENVFQDPGRMDVISELVTLTLVVEGAEAGAERAVRDLMRTRALGSMARSLRGDGEPATLEEFRQTVLAPGRGALLVLPGTERTHVFAIDRERVVCAPGAPLSSWSGLRRALVAEMSGLPGQQADSERASRQAHELSKRLFPREIVERVSNWSELYVECADSNGPLPFELLALGHEPMGKSVPISYLPSLNVGCLLKRLGRDRQSPTGFDSVLIRDPQDIEAALRDPALMNSAVTHFVLHDDDNFLPNMIESLNQGPPLVVLTGRVAGRGPRRIADGGISVLADAFLKGGSTRVVVYSPYYQIAHDSMELTRAFHDRLQTRGDTPAIAMLKARRSLVAEGQTAHRLGYSLMSVVGLGHDPLFETTSGSSTGWLPWLAMVLITIAVITLLVARRSSRT